MKSSFRFLAVLAPLLLAACVPQQVVRNKGDAASLQQQAEREQQLANADHWTLEGLIAVSNGKDGGSGSLTWIQNGDHYDFTVRYNPITGQSVHLTGGPDGAVLEGVRGGPIQGTSAEALMRQAIGWDVPLDELRAWVLAVRAQGSGAALSFGDNKLPSLLEQDGWAVTYPVWDMTRQPPLPAKVFAEKPPYKVRLAIKSWTLQ
jgi:outer membrane lipoprotein LolB